MRRREAVSFLAGAGPARGYSRWSGESPVSNGTGTLAASAASDENTFAAAFAALEVFGDEERPPPSRQAVSDHATEQRVAPAQHLLSLRARSRATASPWSLWPLSLWPLSLSRSLWSWVSWSCSSLSWWSWWLA